MKRFCADILLGTFFFFIAFIFFLFIINTRNNNNDYNKNVVNSFGTCFYAKKYVFVHIVEKINNSDCFTDDDYYHVA